MVIIIIKIINNYRSVPLRQWLEQVFRQSEATDKLNTVSDKATSTPTSGKIKTTTIYVRADTAE